MRRIAVPFVLMFLLLAGSAASASFSPLLPLEPPDTSSPRATLESFLRYSQMYYQALRNPDIGEAVLRESRERAEECFDLSKVAPSIRAEVALESVLRLREILDRIPLPDFADIPDGAAAAGDKITSWRIPHTEINIRKEDRDGTSAFLFTSGTVDRLDGYYEEVSPLPYKENAAKGFYEEYIYSAGWLIPDGFLGILPAWMHDGYQGQAVWQWAGLLLISGVAGVLLWLAWLWHRRRKRVTLVGVRVDGLGFPVAGMALSMAVRHLADTQINITGQVLAVLAIGLEGVCSLFAAWAILVLGKEMPQAIITARNIKAEALNADLIKQLCRLASFVVIFVLFYFTGSSFGIPVTAIFASAGIAGVAVALAARETLANFFGGVSIFLDRPFRAGDYIVLDTGERGEVKAVGMRSTRLLTRDAVQITIPNSVITNVKIVNQSAPYPHFRVRVRVGVAYGSDLDVAEAAILASVEENPLIKETPEPNVRLLELGDSAILYELRVWVKDPRNRGRLVHELNRRIVQTLSEAGVGIPFPQLDVHVAGDSGDKGK